MTKKRTSETKSGNTQTQTQNQNVNSVGNEVPKKTSPEIPSEMPHALPPTEIIKTFAKVLHDYSPENEKEIALTEGESVIILLTNPSGWTKVSKNNKTGWVKQIHFMKRSCSFFWI